MTTWMLYGGPAHGSTGEGQVPDGYEFASRGVDLPMHYGLGPRGFDEIHRWHEDVAYARDARQIVARFHAGEYATTAELSEVANQFAPQVVETLTVGAGFVEDQPESEYADGLRRAVDDFRNRGLI